LDPERKCQYANYMLWQGITVAEIKGPTAWDKSRIARDFKRGVDGALFFMRGPTGGG